MWNTSKTENITLGDTVELKFPFTSQESKSAQSTPETRSTQSLFLLSVICLSAHERFRVNDLYISERDLVILKDMEKNLLEGDLDYNALDVLETTP